MTMFTPALLFCLPLWAAATTLQILQSGTPVRSQRERRPEEDSCPTQWAAMPFVPPSVHMV